MNNLGQCFCKTICLFLAVLSTACSQYAYKDYSAEVGPGKVEVLDLSENHDEAAILYFDSTTYRSIGIPFHRLLLATHVNGEVLPGAGRFSLLDVRGYQAIQLQPGTHSLQWCWLSMNAMGSGGAKCEFRAPALELKPDGRYLVTWEDRASHSGTGQNATQTIHVNVSVIDMATDEQIFP